MKKTVIKILNILIDFLKFFVMVLSLAVLKLIDFAMTILIYVAE